MPGNNVVGYLRATLGLDSAEFETGLKAANDSAKGWSGKISKSVKGGLGDLEKDFARTAGGAGKLGEGLATLGLAGAATGAGLVLAFKGAREAMAFGDDIADTANKLQVTTDYLQEMRFAAHALGGDFKDADEALDGFTKTFGLATSGLSAKALKPFAALGLDPKAFGSVQEALDAVIKKISGLGSAAQQAAVADKLGLTPMLPAIRAGGDAIDDLRKKAHDLGYVMDADLVAKAGDANDNFENLTQILGVQFHSAMVDAIPLVMTLTQWMIDGAKAAGKLGQALSDIGVGIDNLATHDLQGNSMRSDRDKLFGEMMASGKAQIAQPKVSKPQPPPKLKPAVGVLRSVGGEAGGKNKATQVAEASDQAIFQASKDELAARMALVGDIAKLAVLRLAEVDDETRREVGRLNTAAAEGKITKAAAQVAIDKTQEAADSRKMLIQRQAEEDLERQRLDQKAEINGYYDQIAGIEAGLARNATDRAALEAAALTSRQKVEAERTASDLAAQVANGTITASYRDAVLAARADLQASQQKQQAVQSAAAIQAESNQRAEAALDLEISGLSIQADRAKTDAERRAINLRIRDAEDVLERLKLQEIIDSKTAGDAEKDIARARLDMLDATKRTAADRALETMNGAFDDVTHAADDMRQALDNNDWNGALGGLMSAISALTSSSTTTAGKIGALAGVASAVGQTIGGTAGAGLGGAASGAMAGAQIGAMFGGVGAVPGAIAGALLGGISSLFGSSKSKKKAKAAAAAQAAADAAQALAEAQAKAQQVANERRQLEIDLLKAQGKTAEATAMEQEDMLNAVDPANRELKKQVLAEQALADATALAAQKAQEVADMRADIQGRIDQLTLSSTELTEASREKERAAAIALDPTLGDLIDKLFGLEDAASAAAAAATAAEEAQRQSLAITTYLNEQAAAAEEKAAEQRAASADMMASLIDSALATSHDLLAKAYQREADAITATIDKLEGFRDSLKAIRDDLAVDALSGKDGYATARAQLADLGVRMQSGDVSAFEAFQSLSDKFIELSDQFAGSRNAALADRDYVASLTRLGEAAIDPAIANSNTKLAALNASVGGLLDANEMVSTSVMSLADAIWNQKVSQVVVPLIFSGRADEIPAQLAKLQQADIPAFKTGGSFEVGGFGGTDSQLVKMRATPGEMVNISKGGATMDEVLGALKDLDARLSSIDTNTYGTRRNLTRVIDGTDVLQVRAT